MKLLFLLASIGIVAFVLTTNWFWRWLTIPFVLIFAYDVFNTYRDQKRGTKEHRDRK